MSESPRDVPAIVAALDGVTIVCLLDADRLEPVLRKMIDTTVRGVLYEGRDAATVRAACARSHIPHAILDAPPESDHGAWLASAAGEVEDLLS